MRESKTGGPGGGVLLYWAIRGGSARKGCLFQARSILKGGENCHFSIRNSHNISCKVEEMVAKEEYIKGCHILAEMTMQLNKNDWKSRKNVAIIGKFILLAYPWGMRMGCHFWFLVYERGAILVKISILKGKGLNLRAEPPHIKNYWVAPPGLGGGWECSGILVIERCEWGQIFIPKNSPIRFNAGPKKVQKTGE